MSKSLVKVIALRILDSILNILAGSVVWLVLFMTFPPFPPFADISGGFIDRFVVAFGISAGVLLSRDSVIRILNGLVKLKTYIYNRRVSK